MLQTTNDGEGEEKRELSYAVGWKLVQPLYKTLWRFLRKLKVELPYDPAIIFLGIYLEKTIIPKDTSLFIHCSSIYNSQNMKETKCASIEGWMKR